MSTTTNRPTKKAFREIHSWASWPSKPAPLASISSTPMTSVSVARNSCMHTARGIQSIYHVNIRESHVLPELDKFAAKAHVTGIKQQLIHDQRER